jgi:hypothetical protein
MACFSPAYIVQDVFDNDLRALWYVGTADQLKIEN